MACWKNFLLGLGFVLLLFFGIPLHIDQSGSPPIEAERQFTRFLKRFNKSYDSHTEYHHRFKAFQNSLATIHKLNSHRKHNLSAVYGLTKYSDMMEDEFLDKHLQSDLYERISARNLDSRESAEQIRVRRSTKGLPSKVDWREKGVVSRVNNQRLCGACWAFSTVENMETMYAIKHGKLIRLSVQQLIDCARYNNEGCKGGDSCVLLQWMKDYDVEVRTEEVYPLRLRNEECKVHNESFGVRVDKFACETLIGQEDDILLMLAKVGPVAVAINALTWQNYLGGVVQFHCGDAPKLLNHAVQIVGYDLSAEIPHYIVRNSWGEDFGDKGYLYIAIGDNLCGLANEVSVLTVS